MNDDNIHLLGLIFANVGKEYLRITQSSLSDLGLHIQEMTPTRIIFSPWEIKNVSEEEYSLRGEIEWNPLTKDVLIKYIIWPKSSKRLPSFSRLLRWYLLKWNEEHSDSLQGTVCRFLYPCKSNDQIILQAKSKVHLQVLRKRLRLILLKLDTIFKEEWETINMLLLGKCPEIIRNALMNEITSVLLELEMNFDKYYEDKQNEKGNSI